jgi:hypothetical protein
MGKFQIVSWRDYNSGFISEHGGWILKFSFPVLVGMLILIGSVAWYLKWPVNVEITGEIRGSGAPGSEIIVELDTFPNALSSASSGCPVKIRSNLLTARKKGVVIGNLHSITRVYEGENKKVALIIILAENFNTAEIRDILFKKGQKTDMEINVRDMRLYERLFSNYDKM